MCDLVESDHGSFGGLVFASPAPKLSALDRPGGRYVAIPHTERCLLSWPGLKGAGAAREACGIGWWPATAIQSPPPSKTFFTADYGNQDLVTGYHRMIRTADYEHVGLTPEAFVTHSEPASCPRNPTWVTFRVKQRGGHQVPVNTRQPRTARLDDATGHDG